jgi:uncharacterized protein (DUF885 family)
MTTQQVIPNEPSALAVIETMTPALIFGAGAIDPLLIRIRAEVTARASELTVETPTGRKEIASLAYKVARSKTFIDEQRKLLVKDEKERLKKIDAEGSRIWSELETLQRFASRLPIGRMRRKIASPS